MGLGTDPSGGRVATEDAAPEPTSDPRLSPGSASKGGYLRRHFFANRTATAITIAEALVIALGVFEGFSSILTLGGTLAEAGALTPYLWASLIWQALVTGGLLVIFRILGRLRTEEALWQTERVRVEGKWAAEAGHLQSALNGRDAGLELLHRMTEEVRRCATDGHVVNCQERLQSLLGSELRTYVEARLPRGTKVALTVKCISPGPEGTKRLIDIFRDNNQSSRHRPAGGDESLDENYIYQSFQKAGIQSSKWVMVRDTEKMDPQHRRFRDRARERQYRSALAFPLNLPNMDRDAGSSTQLTPLVGLIPRAGYVCSLRV